MDPSPFYGLVFWCFPHPSISGHRMFSQLLGQGGPASMGFPHGLVKEDSKSGVFTTASQGGLVAWRFPQSLAEEDLYGDVCTTDGPGQSRRTRRTRRTAVADASERVAAAGPPWRTRTSALQPPGYRGGRERTRRSAWSPLHGIALCE
ncbi:hypothetical protein Y032_0022g489 [Ancylostoma ceylanicum]|uniref:Uncharacterized protein n=1 Tax=Ancylostoma ceylanicum TaxID=53326 RepID=A0A016UYT0_9BILA|nr:hypothetical protein Y032_0022g489 [Ancylostoma ceylanicum]